uniref:Uncharacterized protein n=1 Tax=Glossina palpalis gambiensis TaxID=67801 RepID=A0A1B0BC32_9MUSC
MATSQEYCSQKQNGTTTKLLQKFIHGKDFAYKIGSSSVAISRYKSDVFNSFKNCGVYCDCRRLMASSSSKAKPSSFFSNSSRRRLSSDSLSLRKKIPLPKKVFCLGLPTTLAFMVMFNFSCSSSVPPFVPFPVDDVDDVGGTSVDPSGTHSVIASSSSVVLSVVFSVDFSLGSSHSVVTALAVVVVNCVNSVVFVMHSSSFEGASVSDFAASVVVVAVVVVVVVVVVVALLSVITHSVVLSDFSLVVVMHGVVVVSKSPGIDSVSQITGDELELLELIIGITRLV